MTRTRGVRRAWRARSGRQVWSLGTWLFVIVLVTMVLVAGATGYAFVSTESGARREAEARARYQSGVAARAIAGSLADAQLALANVAQSPSIVQALRTPRHCTLDAAGIGTFPSAHLDLVLPNGNVACTSVAKEGAPPGATYAGASWISDAMHASAPIVTRVVSDPLTSHDAVIVAAPLSDGGRPVGIVAFALDIRGVPASLRHSFAGPDHFAFTVIDSGGHVVGTGTKPNVASTRRFVAAGVAHAGTGTWRGVDGRSRVFSSAGVPDLGWRVYAGLSTSVVTGRAREGLARHALLALIVGLSLVVMSILARRRVVRPLQSMTRTIVAARASPLPSPVSVGGPIEIATLAREFNAMLDGRLHYEAELTKQALHDKLTGLPNRALLHDRLEHALRTMEGDREAVAVFFLDLNRFKILNDSLGHPAGDALLRSAAERLTTALRPSDTLARFGGDEFVVVSERVRDTSHAVEIARALEAALATPFSYRSSPVHLSAAIGIAIATSPHRDADDLIREADMAMYQAKQEGRSWEVCDDELRARTTQRLELEQDLRWALERNELSVHYQPIYRLDTSDMVGVEALARWQHPERGFVPPDVFIPIAEDSGAIHAIGAHILEQACSDIAALNHNGHDLAVSVNVAVAQLNDLLPVTVQQILVATGLPANRLCLEVTESALVRTLGPEADTLARLRALGVRIAVDDFGTGYSSLSYLRDFQFDILKIDRSFITPLVLSDRADALVDAIMSIARAFDLTVVAEGVETEVQRNSLERLGCSHAQGYLFAKPEPLAELRRRLGERQPRGAVENVPGTQTVNQTTTA